MRFNGGRDMMSSNNIPNPGCFYCRGEDGHRIQECHQVHAHLDLGWVKKIDGQIRLPDGGKVPRDGNKTMKEVVESLNKTKPGIIPMSKIQDKSSLYQDTTMSSSYVQTQGNNPDDNIQGLLEMIQKVGTERIMQALNAQTQNVEEDEWEQNFH